MTLFWDIHQAGHTPRVDASAIAAQAKADRVASNVHVLEARLDKAMMICEALWIIVREKLGLDDELLEKAVRAVDLQDGKLDGKVVREVHTCSACGRKVGRNRTTCIYCGAEIRGNVFD